MIAHRGKFVAYFRVSTDRQGKLSHAQREAVMNYLDGGSWQLVPCLGTYRREPRMARRDGNAPHCAPDPPSTILSFSF